MKPVTIIIVLVMSIVSVSACAETLKEKGGPKDFDESLMISTVLNRMYSERNLGRNKRKLRGYSQDSLDVDATELAADFLYAVGNIAENYEQIDEYEEYDDYFDDDEEEEEGNLGRRLQYTNINYYPDAGEVPYPDQLIDVITRPGSSTGTGTSSYPRPSNPRPSNPDPDYSVDYLYDDMGTKYMMVCSDELDSCAVATMDYDLLAIFMDAYFQGDMDDYDLVPTYTGETEVKNRYGTTVAIIFPEFFNTWNGGF